MNKEKVMEIVNENNGYLYSSIIKNNKIPTIYISRLVAENKLYKVARGVYISELGIIDDYFINSLIYSKIIYSGESALFLNNLSNKQYSNNEISIPYGSSSPKINGYKVVVSRKNTINIGITTVETSYGNKVKSYDKERCICDLFVRQTHYDYEDRVFAINEYKNKYLNLKKLYEYAKVLNVYDEVKNVFEVISWN